MTVTPDEALLDDVHALERADESAMLRVVAGSGAQIRSGARVAVEAGVDRLADEGRPRAVVVAGVGGSGIAGDVLSAVSGPGCPVPVVVHRDYGLPRWVGAADVVIAVSCSGRTEETLSAVEHAISRGCNVVGVGGDDSPLAEIIGRSHGIYIPVPSGRMPRASLWALSVPVLLAARALDVLTVTDTDLAAAADRLDLVAEQARPTSESFVNQAKQVAIDLAGTLPMVWGSSALAGVAAHRFVNQLAENAKYPGIPGVLPEANHNQVVAFDGPFGALAGAGPAELFRDRVDGPESVRLRLVLLRDTEEHPQVTRRCETSRELAEQRGLGVTELIAEGQSPLERLASLVAVTDFASVYLGLLYRLDPTPIRAIDELKAQLAR